METTQIWTGIGIALAIGWVGWVSITLIQNSNKLSAFVSSHDQLHNDNSELKTMLTSMDKRFNQRFDTFLKTEIDELKKISKKIIEEE